MVSPLRVQSVSTAGDSCCRAETHGWAPSQTREHPVQTAPGGNFSDHAMGMKSLQTLGSGATPGRALCPLLREVGQHSNPCRDPSKAHGPLALFHQTLACPTPPFHSFVKSSRNLLICHTVTRTNSFPIPYRPPLRRNRYPCLFPHEPGMAKRRSGSAPVTKAFSTCRISPASQGTNRMPSASICLASQPLIPPQRRKSIPVCRSRFARAGSGTYDQSWLSKGTGASRLSA